MSNKQRFQEDVSAKTYQIKLLIPLITGNNTHVINANNNKYLCIRVYSKLNAYFCQTIYSELKLNTTTEIILN